MKIVVLRAALLGFAIAATSLAQAEDNTTTTESAAVPSLPAETTADTAATDTATTNTGTTETADTAGKLKTQGIRVPDRYGTIEEDRVQAMRSELRYVPTGSNDGYNLVTSEGSQGKSQNAHKDGDLKIPSWNVLSW